MFCYDQSCCNKSSLKFIVQTLTENQLSLTIINYTGSVVVYSTLNMPKFDNIIFLITFNFGHIFIPTIY